jgi:hypothetical protein
MRKSHAVRWEKEIDGGVIVVRYWPLGVTV